MMSPTDPLNIEGMLAFVSVRMMTLDDWIATDRARLPDQPSGLHGMLDGGDCRASEARVFGRCLTADHAALP